MRENTKRPNFLKRKLWIEPVFQKEATWFFIFTAFMGMLAFVGGWLFLGFRFFSTLSIIIDSVSDEARLQLFKSWNEVFFLSIGLGLLFCLVIVILGLYFTNRVAGPIYRIDQDVKKMFDSDQFRQITTRKGDFFKDHLETVNRLIERISDYKKRG